MTTTQPPSPAPQAPDRTLRWDGCINVRDVGGLPTELGGVTRWRALVRADSVRTLTDVGWSSLLGYGVRTIIDLRTPEECERDPARHVPLEVVRVPIVGRTPDEIRAAREAGKLASSFEAATAVYLDLLEREKGASRPPRPHSRTRRRAPSSFTAPPARIERACSSRCCSPSPVCRLRRSSRTIE